MFALRSLRSSIIRVVVASVALGSLAGRAMADDVNAGLQPLHYEGALASEDSSSGAWWDSLTDVPFGESGDYVTLGGEIRERLDDTTEPSFGLTHHRTKLQDALTRLLLDGDLHFGRHYRMYLQLGSEFESGKGNLVSPTDVDRLDVAQGFIETDQSVADGTLGLRLGRQQMSYGSLRLVSTRDPTNIPRAFDGMRAFYSWNDGRIDVFATKPVLNKPGYFDDEPTPTQTFWGVYGTQAVSAVLGLHVDLYYLRFENRKAVFSDGVGDENRETVGTRLWGNAKGWDYNWEFTGQFGQFQDRDIRAWALSTDTGYTFAELPWTPRLGLRANSASGNHNRGSGTFGTYNPLFPALGYYTEAELVIESNLVDLNPSITIHPAAALVISLSDDVLWRESIDDGFYTAPMIPLVSSFTSSSSYLGNQPQALVEWTVSRHFSIEVAYVHFFVSQAFREAGGKSVDFLGSRITYQF